jgi:hypothetical protein
MANLASIYMNQCRWNEAEELLVEAVEAIKWLLGAEHPNALTAMTNLAWTYRNQCQWNKAEVLFVQVIETRKKILGPEHLATMTSIANLESLHKAKAKGLRHKPSAIVSSNGPPSTKLCYLSAPFASPLHEIRFTIISHDQGYCKDPNSGLWTWFEASIVRHQTGEGVPIQLLHSTRAVVEDFSQAIRDQGLEFVSIPTVDALETQDVRFQISTVLTRNPVSSSWQTHEIHWKRESTSNATSISSEFVKALRPGDRIAVWARAQVCIPALVIVNC